MSIDLQDRSSARQHDRVIRRRLSLWQPAVPKHPALMALYRYWMSLCDTGLIPSRQDFDRSQVTAVMAAVTLVELGIADDDEFHPAEPQDELVKQDCLAVRDIAMPLYHDIAALIDDVAHSYARLILPFAADGRHVDRLMIGSAPQEFADLLKLLH
ncbi:MAG TPA: hypothetical protein VH020_09055 [Stellaceae bacterium]|jgi:hypothetical protein|nr:hypothetical protein [Stellaceae bacterium]